MSKERSKRPSDSTTIGTSVLIGFLLLGYATKELPIIHATRRLPDGSRTRGRAGRAAGGGLGGADRRASSWRSGSRTTSSSISTGAASFRWDDGEVRHAVVEEVDAERRLAIRWWDPGGAEESEVTFTLVEIPAGTGSSSPRRRPATGPGRSRRMPEDSVFSALSDPSRRRLLETLAEPRVGLADRARRGAAGDAAGGVEASRGAGATPGSSSRSRAGRETRYRLTPQPLGEALAWMEQIGDRWDERLARLRDAPGRAELRALTPSVTAHSEIVAFSITTRFVGCSVAGSPSLPIFSTTSMPLDTLPSSA